MSNATNKYLTPVGLQQPAAADLSDGTTGSGTVVLSVSPALTSIPTAPTATLGTNTNQIATTAFVQANAGSGSTAGVLGHRRQTIGSADGSTTTFSTIGDVNTTSGSSVADIVNATLGPAIGIFVNSNNVVSGASGNANYRTGRNIAFLMIAGPGGRITDERWWFGLTDQTLATQGASANPAGNYAAFRYDTTVPDTSWQCITKDGTTQTIVSSGIAPIINGPVEFGIIFNDTIPNVTFYINGALVATITTHLPSASTNLRYCASSECFTSGSSALTLEQVFIVSDL
jgi:hypothetical protein